MRGFLYRLATMQLTDWFLMVVVLLSCVQVQWQLGCCVARQGQGWEGWGRMGVLWHSASMLRVLSYPAYPHHVLHHLPDSDQPTGPPTPPHCNHQLRWQWRLLSWTLRHGAPKCCIGLTWQQPAPSVWKRLSRWSPLASAPTSPSTPTRWDGAGTRCVVGWVRLDVCILWVCSSGGFRYSCSMQSQPYCSAVTRLSCSVPFPRTIPTPAGPGSGGGVSSSAHR